MTRQSLKFGKFMANQVANTFDHGKWPSIILIPVMDCSQFKKGGSVKKAQARIWKKKFSNLQICHNQFFYLKTQPIGAWKLQCAQFSWNQF